MPKKRKGPPVKPQQKDVKRKKVEEDLVSLEQRVQELNPAENEVTSFSDLPLSRPTASGLAASHFKNLTDIQQKAVPLAFKGLDILGAAKTGSGKTLAFLVPVLENLYRKRWTEFDGLGALILSPTRELAIQIFEVLRKIGRYHTFSAGLVIGGKSLQEERERLGRMNILVCTPGRMLQHMDQTAAFEIDNLQMLVLDEADRILDMGFQSTVDAIVEHLPKERQTFLFSATQTKKVADLARLSLKDPEYVSVHEAAASATPSTLQQNYIVTALPEKLNTLWSFIRSNLKSKILVFLSSGKQVRFIYESFRHMQPGMPLLHLHGRQKQTARLDITSKFSTTKNSCLFATDVVARGLDFPAVDWVIQVDCPEDADTYIHRVGRTARYERDGRAVLFLDPAEEEGMLKRLEHKKVVVEKINVRQKKQQSIQSQLQNMCFKDPELKYLGQKAFISYVKSINLQKDKEVFKLDQLPLEEYSVSLGLPGAPRVKFVKGDNAKSLKNAPKGQELSSSDEAKDDGTDGKKNQKVQANKPAAVKTKYDRMFERKNQDILSEHYTKLIENDDNTPTDVQDQRITTGLDDNRDDRDFLSIKRRIDALPSTQHTPTNPPLDPTSSKPKSKRPKPPKFDSNRARRILTNKELYLAKHGPKAHRLVFDDQGAPHEVYEFEDEKEFKKGDVEKQREEFRGKEERRLKEVDRGVDKGVEKEKRREKREKRRKREKEERGDSREEVRVELVPFEGLEEEESGGEGDGVVERSGLNGLDERTVERRRKRRKRNTDDELSGSNNLEDLETMASGLLG